MGGESRIGLEELFRIFPSYHPVAGSRRKMWREGRESGRFRGVKILDTRSRRYRADACKAEQFRKIEGARGILPSLHAPGIELANARHLPFILPPIRPGNSFLLPHSTLLPRARARARARALVNGRGRARIIFY